ncbi:MAG: PspA/IM30 family protein [Defluviitaleaceae bacterium]|nr:PspA/IM30 family protein [Defluviitaleaceae bacterium]MCL2240034.1 PspA/IM30 family protein [Defluviitaleaceae bacterium]
MGILTRFADIIAANVNAILDKAEDPNKLVDQYLRKANDELTEVKRETAGIMAEESRTKRLVEENEKEVARQVELARRAIIAGNEDDAKIFLKKKQEIVEVGVSLKLAHINTQRHKSRADNNCGYRGICLSRLRRCLF